MSYGSHAERLRNTLSATVLWTSRARAASYCICPVPTPRKQLPHHIKNSAERALEPTQTYAHCSKNSELTNRPHVSLCLEININYILINISIFISIYNTIAKHGQLASRNLKWQRCSRIKYQHRVQCILSSLIQTPNMDTDWVAADSDQRSQWSDTC
jgi:hypothetical protein